MKAIIRVRRFAFLPVLAAAAVFAACDDDPTEPDEHAEEIAIIRLQIGTQSVDITQGGAQGGVTIGLGAATVTATFLADDGDVVELHDDEFELRMTPGNASIVTFTRAGAFSGLLTGVAAGSAAVSVELFHLEENHADFGPHDLQVTVQ